MTTLPTRRRFAWPLSYEGNLVLAIAIVLALVLLGIGT